MTLLDNPIVSVGAVTAFFCAYVFALEWIDRATKRSVESKHFRKGETHHG